MPDVVAFGTTSETARLAAIPELAVEVLSSDRGADLVRQLAMYSELVARPFVNDSGGL